MSLAFELPNHLLLRHIRDDRDRVGFAAFNAVCNNPAEGATCACLLSHHPLMTAEDFWLVEDLASGQIVSTICLIPWEGRLAGIDLRVAQLEMVLTHPNYRSQGLVRAQIKQFIQAVTAREYDLSIIWGIPYYYRQYGYAYAIDGEVIESLPAWRIPERTAAEAHICHLRPANEADIPRLTALYAACTADQAFYLTRSAAQWNYLLLAAQHPVWMIEDRLGQVLGYAIVSQTTGRVLVREIALPGAQDAWAFLHWLKGLGQPEIAIAWPQTTPLVQLARSFGSQTVRGGQWLLRVADMARFLSRLGPLFEHRLAASAWREVTVKLTINLFREAFRLRFTAGKFSGVDALGFVDASMGADGGELCIPPDAFTRLLFGFRSLEALADAWPDIVVISDARALIETLFPTLPGYLSTPYHKETQ
jgi:predicted acetyltransferase